MEVKVSKHSALTAFEFFLYTALVLETALAAFIYKVIAPEVELLQLKIGLAVLYFGFMAWGVYQLNRVHRARQQFQSTVAIESPADALENVAEPQPIVEKSEASSDPEAPSEPTEPPGKVLGLTGAQFFTVLIVFVTAIVGFTWALSHLGRP